jgi:hypothetical protein
MLTSLTRLAGLRSGVSFVKKISFQFLSVREFANQKHKKWVKRAKGYRGRTNCFQVAKHRVMKAMQYSYRDRKVKRRRFNNKFVLTLIFRIPNFDIVGKEKRV